ncbi:hypothetical protein [Chondromyces crocatus]|nr:hypothetical protein [Chondromyces crocatus]
MLEPRLDIDEPLAELSHVEPRPGSPFEQPAQEAGAALTTEQISGKV